MKHLQFFLSMKPPTTTHQTKSVSVRNGKPVHYEDAKLQATRAKLMSHLSKHVPAERFNGPLRTVVKWCFPKIKAADEGQWKHTRPDAHNLNKLLFDCMTDLGYWHDDAQVACEVIEKFWSDRPGIWISIERIS